MLQVVHLFKISVDGWKIFRVMAVDVSRCITIQPVHDVLQLRVEAVDNWIESHCIFICENYQFKVGVAHLGEKHVHRRSLLEAPTVFVLKGITSLSGDNNLSDRKYLN